jgi:murein DD-endopeptidase MepM/ murein hydrolase activator NlpD
MNPITGGKIPTSGNLSFMAYRGVVTDGTKHWHRGIDIPAPKGTPVKAAESGVVTHAVQRYTPGFAGYGKTVVIKSNTGFFYLYGHLDSVSVKKGARVSIGQKIGTVGYTAFTDANPTGDLKSRAPHLHFETSDSKYPKAREAQRIDPVFRLSSLESTAGIVIALILAGSGYWLFVKNRKRNQ